MKFKHSIGEKVLCFEPDETKARVLYNAKIMDADTVKDVNGKKFVEYKIHFQGWNHAWDRWAEEAFVLKDNEQNRKLQRKLARRAIKKLKLQKGKRRHHLPGVASRPDSVDVNDPDSSSDESFASDMTNSTSTGTRGRLSESEGDEPPDKKARILSTSSAGAPAQPGVEVHREEDSSSSKDDRNHLRKLVSLDIPPSLQRRLEEDNIMITKRNMMVQLPVRPNVVQILENYAKRFAIHSIGAADKQRVTTATGQPAGLDILPPDKRLGLCQEICSDLKLLFDFILPLVLLYHPERDQFRRIIKAAKIGCGEQASPKAKRRRPSPKKPSTDQQAGSTAKRLDFDQPPENEVEPAVDFPVLGEVAAKAPTPAHKVQVTKNPGASSSASASTSTSTKQPSSSGQLSPNTDHSRIHHKKKNAEDLLIEETHKYLIPNQPNLDQTGLSKDAQGRRRSSRLSHHEYTAPHGSHFSDVIYQMSKSDMSGFQEIDLTPDKENGEDDVAGPVKSVFVSLEPFIFLRSLTKHRHTAHNPSGNSEGAGSSKQSTPTVRQPLFNANPYLDKEQYLSAAGSDIKRVIELSKSWNWYILPRDYRPECGTNVPPSLIYGIHHFLRLFVKLPDILMRMAIPEFKVKILVKHLNTLLKFLSEYERELFEVDSYVPVTT